MNFTEPDRDFLEHECAQIDRDITDIAGLVTLIKESQNQILQPQKQKQCIVMNYETSTRAYIGSGNNSIAFLLTLPSGLQIVHKITDNEKEIINEIRGTLLAQEFDVPAPCVVSHGKRYISETLVRGYSLPQGKNINTQHVHACRDLGEKLAMYHQEVSGGVGYILDGYSGEFDCLQDYFESSRDNFETISPELLDGENKRKIRALLQTPSRDDGCCVLHGDIYPENWKIDEITGNLAGIIDFGGLKSGPPEFEFQALLRVQYRGLMTLPIYDITRASYEKASGRKIDDSLVQKFTLSKTWRWFKKGQRHEKIEQAKRVIASIIQ